MLAPVSVLFSEPKIPQSPSRRRQRVAAAVSVLFSEPKIPQSSKRQAEPGEISRFSALQRAENSSMAARICDLPAPVLGFSALQRAENSSIRPRTG